ncbi:alpha/beta-hydrolase [Xylariaceae sp. FL0255]|nr:alpha/beta-hydrolase [Xylariaceae sp. FL0255]
MSTVATLNNVTADGIDIFYREAGPADAPVLLLLHGFPSSSFMFRNLIPLLATTYRLIAPDLPGFGFTTVPASRGYNYTFANFGTTLGAFVDALNIEKYSMYIFDYGAPAGLRLALERPENVTAIVTQNGNAYDAGFGQEFWAPIFKYWKSGSQADRNALRSLLKLNITEYQYLAGSPHPNSIDPATYHLDQTLLDRPGIDEIMLDLFYDYRTNPEVYPDFHKYFRSSEVPVLAVWGKNDPAFIPPGAEAYRRDVKPENFELHFLDAGHFALETNEIAMADYIRSFFTKHGITGKYKLTGN